MFTYCTGTLDYDTKGKTGRGTQFWLEIRKAHEVLEENFKTSITQERIGNQTLFRATQPTPVVLQRHEWFLMDELDGTFNKAAIIAPFRAIEERARVEEDSKNTLEKKRQQTERLAEVKDDGTIGRLIEEVITLDPKAALESQAGKEKALNALVGRVMGLAKKHQVNTDASKVSELLRKRLIVLT